MQHQNGKIFYKFDFHVHTPVSQCYDDNMAPELNLHTTADDIVLAALDAQMDGIAITDHNSSAFIDSIQRAARGTSLTIFPGIEVTAQGCHLLSIFDPDTPLHWLDKLLESIGFDYDHRGDAHYSTEYPLDEVCRLVEDVGGLGIAAHVDRDPRGFIATQYITREEKKRIHDSDHLSALEITDPREKSLWNQGKMGRFTKPYPVVQGSDAHAPKEVGRRPTYLRMPRLDLESLRMAFREYEERVRFPFELEAEGHHH